MVPQERVRPVIPLSTGDYAGRGLTDGGVIERLLGERAPTFTCSDRPHDVRGR